MIFQKKQKEKSKKQRKNKKHIARVGKIIDKGKHICYDSNGYVCTEKQRQIDSDRREQLKERKVQTNLSKKQVH